MTEPVRIGDATLYCGDLIDILPTLQRADLCIVDPPYGIGESNEKGATRGKLAAPIDYGHFEWDNEPLSELALSRIYAGACRHVIWGGNYYPVPPSGKWLVWDKQNGATDFADCELAWTNLPGAVRIFRHMWSGMLRASERNLPRVHPTQKPIALMEWCLQQAGDVKSVIDPCMGSAPVGIACARAEISYIGIEKSERHFATACERIDNAYRQSRMFA